jgi:putative hemolysin
VSLTPAIAIILILVFAAASYCCALAESALFSLGQWQARRLAPGHSKQGECVAELLREPQELLATLVLGNTLANAGMVATALVIALQGHWPLFGSLLLVLILILVGCEVVPKTLAVRRPERWALRVAGPTRALQRLSRPLRHVAQWANQIILRLAAPKAGPPSTAAMSDEEYQELLEMAYQQGTLAQTEKEIILQIISLDRRTAKEVMRPRSQMACISDDLSLEEMLAAARRFKHRRLPIYDESADTIVGILNTRRLLLDPAIDLAEAIEFPSFVPDSMNLLQLLNSLQRQQRGLAVVLDEFGGTAGLVTMEDILEAMIGEIRSEGEETGFVMEKLGDGRWRVSGTMRLEDFRREYPALDMVPEVETMGGLLVAKFEVVPAVGQSLVVNGLRLTALVADDRRVRELLVEAVKKRGGP